MLSNDEILHLYIQQNIPPGGRMAVDRIRTSDPARRVGGGSHNVVTRFASLKMGCVIQAESHKGELPFVYQWEHDPNTFEFYDQPSRVKLAYKSASGRLTSHLSTPDFFLIQKDWMGWVECKPEEKLVEGHALGSERFIPDGHGGWRCPSGEEFAARYGLGFQVCSSKSVNWMLVRNLEFLSDYLQTTLPEVPQQTRRAVTEGFRNTRWLLLAALLRCPGVNADAVYSMVAAGDLHVDIEHELFSEPGFTTVCRDRLSLEAYRHHRRLETNRPLVPLHSILMAPGTRLLWDGRPWTILNVGKADIVLEDENHAISSINLDVFQKFIGTGAIAGLLTQTDNSLDTATAIMKKASPVDIEHALARIGKLEAAETGSVDVPARTLRYWRKRAEEGELAYGNRFTGLVPRISARGNRDRKIDEAVIAVMHQVIKSDVLNESQPKISACYGTVRNICLEKGLFIPSEKTFRAEIQRYRENDVTKLREGERAAYADSDFQWYIDQSTPRHGERPFEIGHIDHTELDVELVDSRTGANLGRPWLTVLIDAFTRLILAFFLTFDSPSYRSCMGVIRNAIQRHGRIPKTIVVDKGSDFEGLYFEALIARLQSHKKSRPTAKGRFGSVIERYFGLNNQMLIHNLAGNNQALQRPRSMSPSHDPRKLAVWTLPTLVEAFGDFVDNTYANLFHPALGMSPKEAMTRGLLVSGRREHRLISYDEDFIRLCMPTTPAGKALVRPGRGVKIRGIQYWHPVFREPRVERTKVNLRYDPFDVSRAYALVNGEWVLCRSEHQALFERRSEKEIAAITQEIRRLHQLAEISRGVNASDIAAFIGRAKETEAVLRQQKRDAERQAQDPQLVIDTSPNPGPGAYLKSPANQWVAPTDAEIFEVLE
jgi:transposase InsO family protein